MYIFARYIKLDRTSSLLSSIIFMFSGFFVAHIYMGHYTIIAVACWIPLIFLLFEIALNKQSLFYGLITGVFIGFQFLAGHMQISKLPIDRQVLTATTYHHHLPSPRS